MNSRLHEVEVEKILLALQAGEDGRDVAKRFGVYPSYVSEVRTGKRWAGVRPDIPRGAKMRRLRAQEVREILLSEEDAMVLSERYGVTRETIYRVRMGHRHGKYWTDLERSGEAWKKRYGSLKPKVAARYLPRTRDEARQDGALPANSARKGGYIS